MRVSRVGGDVSEESFAVPDEQQRYPVQSFPQASGANLRARAFHLNRQDPAPVKLRQAWPYWETRWSVTYN